jgi:hypothetical protein
LQIDQDCNWFSGVGCSFTHEVKPILVFLISAMRKVEASDIHSSRNEFGSFLWTLNSWAHRADYFCAAHLATLFHSLFILEINVKSDGQRSRSWFDWRR